MMYWLFFSMCLMLSSLVLAMFWSGLNRVWEFSSWVGTRGQWFIFVFAYLTFAEITQMTALIYHK